MESHLATVRFWQGLTGNDLEQKHKFESIPEVFLDVLDLCAGFAQVGVDPGGESLQRIGKWISKNHKILSSCGPQKRAQLKGMERCYILSMIRMPGFLWPVEKVRFIGCGGKGMVFCGGRSACQSACQSAQQAGFVSVLTLFLQVPQ